MKSYTAAPPDVLRVDEKNLREHSVPNVCGIVITTNYQDALYLPADDRRHLVTWSDLSKADFPDNYWNDLWAWFYGGGHSHVAAYLHELDITKFDPKAPPPKTDAFWVAVEAGRAPERTPDSLMRSIGWIIRMQSQLNRSRMSPILYFTIGCLIAAIAAS